MDARDIVSGMLRRGVIAYGIAIGIGSIWGAIVGVYRDEWWIPLLTNFCVIGVLLLVGQVLQLQGKIFGHITTLLKLHSVIGYDLDMINCQVRWLRMHNEIEHEEECKDLRIARRKARVKYRYRGI
jgi:hypothetical protein